MMVRSFQLSDCSRVTELLKDVLSETCYEDTMEAFANQLSLDSELVLVAAQNNQIVGVVIGTIDDNRGYYYRIAVDRNNQRKGIGKLMIQAMKQRFEKRKVDSIMVSLDTHNEPILSLYESLGYQAHDSSNSKQRLKIISG
jgi:ribosomal protein S18 acetylase RimI-like enzyme